MQAFYEKLLAAINAPIFRDGQWRLCERTGWPDNPSYQNLVAWSWVKDDDRCLIVVNLSDGAVQARVQVPWEEVRGETWRLIDALTDASYDRDGDEMAASGLYVELEPWITASSNIVASPRRDGELVRSNGESDAGQELNEAKEAPVCIS